MDVKDDQSLTARLAALGLTANQARTYLGLLHAGECSATEAAAAASVPRPKIYEALRSLERAGFCAPAGNRVARWKAVAPETALPEWIEQRELERRAEAAREAELGRELVPLLSRFVEPAAAAVPMLGALIGRERIAVAFEELVAGASRQLDIVQAEPMVQERSRWNVLELEALARGVEVRLICTPETAARPERYRPLLPAGGKVRLSNRLSLKLAIRDAEEALVALRDPTVAAGEQDVTAMRVFQEDLVSPLVTLFRREWRASNAIRSH